MRNQHVGCAIQGRLTLALDITNGDGRRRSRAVSSFGGRMATTCELSSPAIAFDALWQASSDVVNVMMERCDEGQSEWTEKGA